MPDDWVESSEGSLDPDLTEEHGYLWYEPPRRRWRRVGKALIVVVLAGLLGSAVMVVMR